MTSAQAAAILRWWVDAGVDLAIEDAPRDRFQDFSAPAAIAEPRAVERVAEPQREAPRAAAAPAPPAEAAFSARARAAGANTLGELRAAMLAFDGCALKGTATQLVFDDGNRQAKIMLIGEAPGADEDRTGRPFAGRAGQLLDNMLASIGLDRAKVAIAYVVPWRPPGNRTPTPQETAVCLPFLKRQIALADPRILVCLGGNAAQSLLATKEGIIRTRGKWLGYVDGGGAAIPLLATLNPVQLLAKPLQKRLAWADLLKLRTAVEALG